MPWAAALLLGAQGRGGAGRAAPDADERLETLGGHGSFRSTFNIAQPGDWRITTSQGDQYFLGDAQFRRRYREGGRGRVLPPHRSTAEGRRGAGAHPLSITVGRLGLRARRQRAHARRGRRRVRDPSGELSCLVRPHRRGRAIPCCRRGHPRRRRAPRAARGFSRCETRGSGSARLTPPPSTCTAPSRAPTGRRRWPASTFAWSRAPTRPPRRRGWSSNTYGASDDQVMHRVAALGAGVSREEAERLFQEERRHVGEHQPLEGMPGAAGFLAALRARGIPLSVVTFAHTSRERTMEQLRQVGALRARPRRRGDHRRPASPRRVPRRVPRRRAAAGPGAAPGRADPLLQRYSRRDDDHARARRASPSGSPRARAPTGSTAACR